MSNNIRKIKLIIDIVVNRCDKMDLNTILQMLIILISNYDRYIACDCITCIISKIIIIITN